MMTLREVVFLALLGTCSGAQRQTAPNRLHTLWSPEDWNRKSRGPSGLTNWYRVNSSVCTDEGTYRAPKLDFLMGIKAGGCKAYQDVVIPGQDEFDHTSCCNMRTVCSQVCGVTVASCEVEFQACLAHACLNDLWPHNASKAEDCRSRVKHFKGRKPKVKQVTEEEHEQFQQARCECLPDKDAQKERHLSLLQFLLNGTWIPRREFFHETDYKVNWGSPQFLPDPRKRARHMYIKWSSRLGWLHYENVKMFGADYIEFKDDEYETWIPEPLYRF